MTGPEAIAAAERLPEQLREHCERIKSLGWDGYHCQDFSPSERCRPCKTADVVATLRSALLQSQEALQKLQTEHPRTCGWWRAEGETGCTCNRGLDSDIIKAALSPPVAPKEP